MQPEENKLKVTTSYGGLQKNCLYLKTTACCFTLLCFQQLKCKLHGKYDSSPLLYIIT